MHTFAFTVQGMDEAQVDRAITQRMEQFLQSPTNWLVTQKNMEVVKLDLNDSQVDVVMAQVICVALAGWLPWFTEEVADGRA